MFVSKYLLILLFLFGTAYGQTFTSTVTVQKDLRVQQETILGGVNKPVAGDMFIFYDTIYAPNIFGSGSFLTLDGSGYIKRSTAAAGGAGTVTSIATTSPIGGGTITTTGTLNLLATGANKMLYSTGVNTWAETNSTAFGRSQMDDASAADGLATLSVPTTLDHILFGDGTDIASDGLFTYNALTTILNVSKFAVDGADGRITKYEDVTATDGTFFIGNAARPAWKTGSLLSSDLTVGYSDPNITLDYAAGSIVNADINASAAIAATKINTGVVTNTEFNYLDGVTSAVQTQLDAKGYTLQITGSQGTVNDATSYYSGAITTGTGTTAAINRVPIPKTGTITDIYVYQLTAGTLSSGESSTLAIRYDNTTDVTVSASVLNSSASLDYSATGLSQAVTAGHYIELKFTSATWATNPTNVRWTCIVFIKS